MVKIMSVEERRGIETIDINQNLLLVRAPIESVAEKLSRARRADVWERDISTIAKSKLPPKAILFFNSEDTLGRSLSN